MDGFIRPDGCPEITNVVEWSDPTDLAWLHVPETTSQRSVPKTTLPVRSSFDRSKVVEHPFVTISGISCGISEPLGFGNVYSINGQVPLFEHAGGCPCLQAVPLFEDPEDPTKMVSLRVVAPESVEMQAVSYVRQQMALPREKRFHFQFLTCRIVILEPTLSLPKTAFGERGLLLNSALEIHLLRERIPTFNVQFALNAEGELKEWRRLVLPELLRSTMLYHNPTPNHAHEFEHLLTDLWRTTVASKKSAPALSHLSIKTYCPPFLLYSKADMASNLEYLGDRKYIFEWTAKALEEDARAQDQHVTLLQMQFVTYLFGRRAIQLEIGGDMFTFVQMASAKAAYAIWEPLSYMLEIHFAVRKFSSSGMSVGAAITPPLSHVHPGSDATDHRLSLETLKWVNAATSDSVATVASLYGEPEWHADILGVL